RVARTGSAAAATLLGPRLKPAPPSPLDVPIGPHRRLAHATVPVTHLKRIKDTFGGTVNDVVLAATAGAIRTWMADRGLRTDRLELRAAVPLGIEGAGREPRPMAMTYAPLPVGEPDPLARLERVRRSMAQKLARLQPLGAARMTAATEDAFAPPSVLAQAARLRFDARRFNVLVANVPGPQNPMYLLGRRLETAVPVPFLAGDRALAIAVTSYDGLAEFGLLGDLDKLADLETVAAGVTAAVDELLTLARRGRTARRLPRSAR
ncbi:WS/DGAT domain-containing protein, partial [Patulibacter sp. S7RM1-6]